jgi:hypothetical protein
LPLLRWGALFEDLAYRIVAEDDVYLPGPVTITVRTIWNGFTDPILDQTMYSTVIKVEGGGWSIVDQYGYEVEAVDGHKAVVDRTGLVV